MVVYWSERKDESSFQRHDPMPSRGNYWTRTSNLNLQQKKQTEAQEELNVVDNSSFFTPGELLKELFAKGQNVNSTIVLRFF